MPTRFPRARLAWSLALPLLLLLAGCGGSEGAAAPPQALGPCTPEECGALPPVPTWICTDGTTGGPSACTRGENEQCSYGMKTCEPAQLCPTAVCTRAPGIPAACPNDPTSWGGPTGYCALDPKGACVEIVRACRPSAASAARAL